MTEIRVQVILKTADNISENYVTNSLCVVAPNALSSTAAITTAVKDFYDDLGSTYLSSALAQNGHTIKYSLLPGTPPNYPYEEDVFNLGTAPSGTPFPSEMAVCLSFQGDRQAGFPQARRRGRIYIGPLGNAANNLGRPHSTFISQLATAGATFKSNIAAIGTGHYWAIWSGTDQTAVEVNDGWVDNAFDVQRRRGLTATTRTTFGLAG